MCSSCASDTQTHTQGRKRCSDKVPVWLGGPAWPSNFKAMCVLRLKRSVMVKNESVFFPASLTHKCSAESVDEGLSFSSGGLSSNTMVSVLARQNPLDLMISEKYEDTWSALLSAWLLPRWSVAPLTRLQLHPPEILMGLWMHGWILCTLSFLSTWSSGDRSKKVSITSDLEYYWVQKQKTWSSESLKDFFFKWLDSEKGWPWTACWSHSSVVVLPRSISPRCHLLLWFLQGLKT